MKNKNIFLILAGLIIASMVLGACQSNAVPTLTEEEMALQVAGTRSAIATQNAIETLVAKVTELSVQPTCPVCPTCPLPPTATIPPPTPTVDPNLPTATPVTAPVDTGRRCLQFEFLGDVNYPPGTVVKPGTKFDKTWRVRNTGTCEWTVEFDLVMSGGEAFGTNKRADIKEVVYPGDVVELTIRDLVAPMTAGTYYSYWMVAAPDGARVGYGPNQQWGLGIQIVVSND
ncbi:MAG: NBR1-Ig-like domain-containing protein [Anaerolineaceae bacterium]|jgi:hypothetical protein